MVGKAISHYRILDKIGEGGMGVVYKARDTHLDRFVAIKVLNAEAVADTGRKKRFVQEAKAASALNHPNIIPVYDIDDQDGIQFMAMEYVPGKPLDQLISRRGMPLNAVLKYGIEIADALLAAHEAGIVHRDVKPSNIIVGDDGRLRVLDFGLAKLTDAPKSFVQDAMETVTVDRGTKTEEGTILGTVSYMSPEQAEGTKVDARSDIFSFGAVLYEMVTGHRAFQRDSNLSTLSAVLRDHPKPMRELAQDVPADLERIVNRCLRKDVERRFQYMKDLKVELQELKEQSDSGALEVMPSVAKRRWASLFTIVAVSVAVIAVAIAAWVWFRKPVIADSQTALRPVPLTSDPGFEGSPTFSPEGDRVAFTSCQEDNCDIYVKLIGTETEQQLTNDPLREFSPAWSPDGREIAFWRELSGGKRVLMLMPSIGGGRPRTLTEVPAGQPLGGSPRFGGQLAAWHPSGKFLAMMHRESANESLGVFLVSAETGEKKRLTSPPIGIQEDSSPAFSPNGRTLAFTRGVEWGAGDLYLVDLAENLDPVAPPRQLTSAVGMEMSPTWSVDGQTIIYTSLPDHMMWRVRADASEPPRLLDFADRGAGSATVSTNGARLVYSVARMDSNIWRLDLASPGRAAASGIAFISSSWLDQAPTYSPDGTRIAFESGRSGTLEIWICDADGTNLQRATFLNGPVVQSPRWSPDGERLAFTITTEGQREVFMMPVRGGKPQRMTDKPGDDSTHAWSRDGKWIYIRSNRTGTYQVWKVPVGGGEAVQVTRNGGNGGQESFDGVFLFYSKDAGGKASLWKVPLGGGEESQVLDSLYRRTSFVVAREGIYFIPEPTKGKHFSIQFFDLATGNTRSVAEVSAEPGWGLTVSPDGRNILWAQSDEGRSDLMLVENFR